MKIGSRGLHGEVTKTLYFSNTKNGWFPFNTYTMAEARDLKFDTQLGFANAYHKTTPRGQVGMGFG